MGEPIEKGERGMNPGKRSDHRNRVKQKHGK